MSIVAFRCSSYYFAAFRCFSFPFLLFLVFRCCWYQPPSIGPEMVRINEWKREWKREWKMLFVAVCRSFWFFISRFGFSSSDVHCYFSLLFVSFCCFSLPFLLFLVFHCSWCQPPFIGPELVRMNENGNETCSLLLFVVRFSFWCVFPFAVGRFCCSSYFSFLFLR